MELTVGFSPCPNDTFIFEALLHGKIDTGKYRFTALLEDVETLNQWAGQGKLAITKMSFAASGYLQQQYDLLPAGAALGKGVGPLLITNANTAAYLVHHPEALQHMPIAVPGEKTTANFLLHYYCSVPESLLYMPFHSIENWVLSAPDNENRLGVIIHENRFTYAAKGLVKVQDLGAYWELKTGLPIPLGGIFIQSGFSASVKKDIAELIRKSVAYAFEHYTHQLPEFVKVHAQEMEEEIMWQHIRLYVNEETLQISNDGIKAIQLMRDMQNNKAGTMD